MDVVIYVKYNCDVCACMFDVMGCVSVKFVISQPMAMCDACVTQVPMVVGLRGRFTMDGCFYSRTRLPRPSLPLILLITRLLVCHVYCVCCVMLCDVIVRLLSTL